MVRPANKKDGNYKAPKRAYYRDAVDPTDIEKELEDPDKVLFSSLKRVERFNALRRFSKKQAVTPKAVEYIKEMIKTGTPLIYNRRTGIISPPISKPSVKSTGYSNVTIATDLTSAGALEAAASIYLGSMQVAMTREELEEAAEKVRAEQEEEAKRDAKYWEEKDDEEMKWWLQMETNPNIVKTVSKAKTEGTTYQKER